ncbi:DUF2383 domain-containing protein [Mesonia sp. K4-1]|uniref:DUF2383 domain-containing protein n=1 Tax=Mesonia sp. K4-1 TaxID=2602760 RepID=UPI0011CBFCE8|nr:DUF2383 domain-containing protein [Mesonia sp. K4-1]TXK73167.1 DUF2383 domain-containing protein [Mesonia sp. K4-1]
MRDSEIVIELNRLIKINKEAIQSLVTALNKIRSEDLFNHFNSQAEERQVFVDQLSVKLRAYYPNEKVNDAECTSIKLYPNLHELKGSLPDEIVLAKFTQAEKYAIEEYEKIATHFSEVGHKIKELICLQKEKIEQSLQELKRLKL